MTTRKLIQNKDVMNYLNYNKITRVMTILLTLFVSVFAVPGVSHAQNINAVPSGGDDTISITARVLGCGDDMVQTNLGEQCDGLDLNNQSCSTIGFDSGALSCRNSCIFETSLCIGGNNNSGRGSVRNVGDIFDGDRTKETNVVFTGIGEPDSTFFVSTADGVFTSVNVDSDGDFSITVSEPVPGDYDFTFYTLSSDGLNGPINFSTPIQQYATTFINNIFIPYQIVEPIIPEVDVPMAPVVPNIPDETIDNSVDDTDQQIDGDLYREFLDVLAESDDLSPEELRELIRVFSEQNGYTADVPGYTPDGLRLGLLPYLERQWLKIPEVGRKWYPNVYISFMEPYRIFFYEGTHWYNEIYNPVLNWLWR